MTMGKFKGNAAIVTSMESGNLFLLLVDCEISWTRQVLKCVALSRQKENRFKFYFETVLYFR